jgi:hypothetical protein
MSEERPTATGRNAAQPEAAISAANDTGMTLVSFHAPSRRPLSYVSDRGRAPP